MMIVMRERGRKSDNNDEEKGERMMRKRGRKNDDNGEEEREKR